MNNHDISVPQISLPQGGGAIKGLGETFETTPFSGTANLSIPIYASPARSMTKGDEELVARGEQQIACMLRKGAGMEATPVPRILQEALHAYS